jgi:type I restriction enzyme M protein
MNLLLHGIGAPDAESPLRVEDALAADPGDRFTMVLTNPPFGKKSSVTFVNAEGDVERESLTVVRDDFWASTSNKLVQHVKTLLQAGGRAAIVVPDNVLFEGGAGETVRRKLLTECDVHTLLRLPTGIFYGRRRGRSPSRPAQQLDDFVDCYRPGARHERAKTERFRRFGYDELVARDKVSLDIFWLRDESLEDADGLPAPGVIAAEIAEDLEAAREEFSAIAASLGTADEGV